MTTDPKQLLAGPLRRAGIADAEAIVLEQLAALRGHQLLADDSTPPRRRTAKPSAPIQRCANPDDPHNGTELVNKTCPICGWSLTP